MAKTLGGVTATINCMIISGFPGIGKTSTYNEIKKRDALARAVDMDVKDYGTTNGIDVADPAAYVRKVEELSKTNEVIFVSTDPVIRQKLRDARLFYIVVAPEFPPKMASAIPNYRPNPLLRAEYMKRFSDNIGYNSLAAQTLDGKGYEDALIDLFKDPMIHFVNSNLTRQVVDQAWMMIDQLTRQVINAQTLMPGMPGGPKPGQGIVGSAPLPPQPGDPRFMK